MAFSSFNFCDLKSTSPKTEIQAAKEKYSNPLVTVLALLQPSQKENYFPASSFLLEQLPSQATCSAWLMSNKTPLPFLGQMYQLEVWDACFKSQRLRTTFLISPVLESGFLCCCCLSRHHTLTSCITTKLLQLALVVKGDLFDLFLTD